MGCVSAKHSMNSPTRGLEKLKLENGYGKRGSTGPKKPAGPRPPSRPESKNSSAGGSDAKGKVVGSGRGGSGGLARVTSKSGGEDELVGGWPKWLTDNIPREALAGLVPRSAETYDKLDKVGQGTYSNVYKARDRETGKIVALKKVRFDKSEPESVKFMAREIAILRKLDHPNIIKLEGLATSRMQYSLYLVFDYMQTDLYKIISRPDERLTEPQVKCYMQQLLSGLQHCHDRGILHRDIKGSNLLIDRNGMLKIADWGLANSFNPNKKGPLTNRVVTLWYRAPELLLDATDYGPGIDLWSAGCLLAEMFVGRPILPGRTEVEQLHRIFKLCGTPTEDYWKRSKVPTTFRPPRSYKPNLVESFRDFPSCLGLLQILLSIDPAHRACAGSALQNEFFHTSPLACDLSGLPVTYVEDDNTYQTSDRRRHRNSKMRRRSKTLEERRRKDQPTQLPQDADSSSLKEEQVKSEDQPATLQSQDLDGSTSSTLSKSKATQKQEAPPLPPLPPLFSPEISPRSEAHRHATKNIKSRPPLPNSRTRSTRYNDDSEMYKLSQVQRSASTREFRKFNQIKRYELHALDD
ncbi:hypothetical protein LguiB_010137 [Lonicera macranthoides]